MYSIYNFIKKNKNYNLLPKSLLARFLMIVIIPTVITQILSIYFFYQRHWYNVSQYTSNSLVTEIESLINSVDYKNDPNEKKIYLNLEYVFLPNTSELPKNTRYIREFKIFKNTLNKKIGQFGKVILEEDQKVDLYLKVKDGVLKIKLPHKSLINSSTYVFIAWMSFSALILLTVSIIFLKNQVRSIIELTKAADLYGHGHRDYNYKPSGSKEIRKAGVIFLKMKNRIEKQRAKRMKMLAMISHDLKTPLTRMKLQIELMEDSEEKEELKHDIETMQHMIASYLDFSRGESNEEFITVDLKKWVKDFISTKYKNHNIDLGRINLKQNKNDFITEIKPYSFARALSNLIENSIKYSSKAKITVYSDRQNIIVDLEDNGVGIKEEDRKLVFKPFYRLNDSRTLNNDSNVGLGLAIVKEIINGHLGNITLDTSPDLKGLLVRIKLPKRKDINTENT